MDRVLKQMTPTGPELIDRLKKSARQPKTREQRFAQTVSSVFGNQPDGMNLSREEVGERLKNVD